MIMNALEKIYQKVVRASAPPLYIDKVVLVLDLLIVIKKYFKPISIVLILVALFIGFKYIDQSSESNEALFRLEDNIDNNPDELKYSEQSDVESPIKEEISTDVFIDVKGAVLKPNVYKLQEGSRVLDAISIAGGFAEDADQSKINLAARVQDEMVIYVPKVGEDANIDGNINTFNEEDGKVNINTANEDELLSLSGIGPAKAASIIAYRQENGRFQKVEDLVNVSGIGEKSLEKILDQITVR